MGRRKFTGHSLRVACAQFLAGQGLPVHLIQLQARWASAVVFRYVQDSPLNQITESFLIQSLTNPVAGDETCTTELRQSEKVAELPIWNTSQREWMTFVKRFESGTLRVRVRSAL
eukprot:2414093-Amphidinium_carterae.1